MITPHNNLAYIGEKTLAHVEKLAQQHGWQFLQPVEPSRKLKDIARMHNPVIMQDGSVIDLPFHTRHTFTPRNGFEELSTEFLDEHYVQPFNTFVAADLLGHSFMNRSSEFVVAKLEPVKHGPPQIISEAANGFSLRLTSQFEVQLRDSVVLADYLFGFITSH